MRGSDLGAEVGLVRLAEDTVPFSALRCVAGDDQVTRLVFSDTLTNVVYDSRGFVTED